MQGRSLPAHRHRDTRQQVAILKALRQCEDFVSAQELHHVLADNGLGIGLSTVYRQLNSLAGQRRVDTIRIEGEQKFRVCTDEAHHHHLVCESCGRTIEIEPPEQWLRQVARENGFKVSSHTLEIFGQCEQCTHKAQKTS